MTTETASDGTLRILLSRDSAGKLADDIRKVMGARRYVLVFPDESAATSADIAFVSRDVTGLSTKHDIKPDTQRFYDALRDAQNLRWVHTPAAGVDRPIYEVLGKRGVVVTASSGVNAPVVAHSATLGLLALARRWPLLLDAQRRHEWFPVYAKALPHDIRGQTAVIVGWGPVGQQIGRLLQALGLNLAVARRSGEPVADDVPTASYSGLRELLPRADWLLLACPLSDETHHLVGREEFAMLPAQCGLVNVARGDVVDEQAMIDVLREGRIAGAYLDVFAHEPLHRDSPLWDMPNVIVTPHMAGMSDANEPNVARLFLKNLEAFLTGSLLRHV
ncbi:MAG: D-2-hydroxyacid dehydrogenase [Pseudomonadota bacterium]